MNEKHLAKLGVPAGEPTRAALQFISHYCIAGHDKSQIPTQLLQIIAPIFVYFIVVDN